MYRTITHLRSFPLLKVLFTYIVEIAEILFEFFKYFQMFPRTQN